MLQVLIGTNFPFMRFRRIAFGISSALVVATAAWLIVNGGPLLGVDFAGGTLLQVRTSEMLAPQDLRDVLSSAGHSDTQPAKTHRVGISGLPRTLPAQEPRPDGSRRSM